MTGYLNVVLYCEAGPWFSKFLMNTNVKSENNAALLGYVSTSFAHLNTGIFACSLQNRSSSVKLDFKDVFLLEGEPLPQCHVFCNFQQLSGLLCIKLNLSPHLLFLVMIHTSLYFCRLHSSDFCCLFSVPSLSGRLLSSCGHLPSMPLTISCFCISPSSSPSMTSPVFQSLQKRSITTE
ncbi:hypothetical protein AMECASPLE_009643 [Ameca splendens]|uniref:Uncharacterized protein n=1 Tax=Ameca splendens TaxID=208324 RepID=A0ABV0Y0D3_9TELE